MAAQPMSRRGGRASGGRFEGVWSTAFALLGAVAAITLILGIGTGETLLLVVAASCVPTMLLLGYNVLAKRHELFSPLNFVLISVFFGVTVQSFYLCLLDDRGHRFAVGVATDADSLLVAIAAISIAIACLLAGYAIAGRGATRAVRAADARSWSEGRLTTVCSALIGVSLVSLAYYVAVFDVLDEMAAQFSVKRRLIDEDTGVSRTLGYVRFGVNLSQLAFFLLASYYWSFPRGRRPSRLRPLLWLAGSAGLVMPFVASSRLGLLSFVLGAMIVHHYATGGWKVRRVGAALAIAIAVVVAMGGLRYAQTRGLSYTEYRAEQSTLKVFEPILGSSNFLGVGKTSAIIEAVPDRLDYLYGYSYVTWIIAPIPRAFWPDKPVVRIGRVLGFAIFGTAATTGIPPGAVGELYLNFGWLGIPVGALLLGLALRWYANRFERSSYSNVNYRVIYASTLIFVAFTGISSDFTGTVSAVLQRLVPLVFLLGFVSRAPLFAAPPERGVRTQRRPRGA